MKKGIAFRNMGQNNTHPFHYCISLAFSHLPLFQTTSYSRSVLVEPHVFWEYGVHYPRISPGVHPKSSRTLGTRLVRLFLPFHPSTPSHLLHQPTRLLHDTLKLTETDIEFQETTALGLCYTDLMITMKPSNRLKGSLMYP